MSFFAETLPSSFSYKNGLGEISDANYRRVAETLPELGAGAARTAYALNGEYVLKVCRNGGGGWQDCSQEADTFLRAKRDGWDHLLAPIVAVSPSGAWSVQMRIADVGVCGSDYGRYGDSEFANDVYDKGVSDVHSYNYGRTFDDRTVMIDYAIADDGSWAGRDDDDDYCRCGDCQAERSAERHEKDSHGCRCNRCDGTCVSHADVMAKGKWRSVACRSCRGWITCVVCGNVPKGDAPSLNPQILMVDSDPMAANVCGCVNGAPYVGTFTFDRANRKLF
jgi:hypothetical protein